MSRRNKKLPVPFSNAFKYHEAVSAIEREEDDDADLLEYSEEMSGKSQKAQGRFFEGLRRTGARLFAGESVIWSFGNGNFIVVEIDDSYRVTVKYPSWRDGVPIGRTREEVARGLADFLSEENPAERYSVFSGIRDK